MVHYAGQVENTRAHRKNITTTKKRRARATGTPRQGLSRTRVLVTPSGQTTVQATVAT